MNEIKQKGSIAKYLYTSTIVAWVVTFLVWIWLSVYKPFEGISGLFLIPFILDTFVLTIISVYVGISKKLLSSNKYVKIIGFFILAFIPIIIGYIVYEDNQPYSKEETIKIIQNCEIYSVTLENKNRVVLNYINKDRDYKTNLADPLYFEDYADSAKLQKGKCYIDVNRR